MNVEYDCNCSVTKYKYSATGQKLGVEYYVAAPNVTVAFGAEPDALTLGQTLFAGSTQYLLGGSLVMKDGLINKFLFDGGYAQATAANPTTYSFSFYYYNQDHLGNNREVVDASGTVRQVTNYYPFGTPYTESSAVMDASLQPYKYNGKELDRMHGLNTYDYGARQYDPVLGRWDRMDPLCEKYYDISPYAYCGNNPVNAIDPDGRYIISKEQAKKYPKLNLYLQKGIHGILDNPKIMHALRVAGRFNDEQIKEMVTYGKGPIINITNTDDNYGFFTPDTNSKTLNINEDIVKELESSEGYDADICLFLTAVTILHESAHYGDDLAGNPEGEKREDGEEFEKLAYGKVITKSNVKEYLSDFYLKSQKENKYVNKEKR